MRESTAYFRQVITLLGGLSLLIITIAIAAPAFARDALTVAGLSRGVTAGSDTRSSSTRVGKIKPFVGKN